MHALSALQQVQVAALDISSLIRLVWTPRGVGDPVDVYCIVEGLRHEIGADRTHEVTFRLSDADRSPAFVLDDAIFGVLDAGNVLAF
jgi:hypothetical protein